MSTFYKIFIFTLLIFAECFAQSAAFDWFNRAGGIFRDTGYALATDAAGNIFMTGRFDQTADFGQFDLTTLGSSDIFISKHDPSGNVLWVQQAGGSSFDVAEGIVIDANGNCIIAGYFNESFTIGDTTLIAVATTDLVVAKFDNDGNFLWAEQGAGGGTDFATDVATDAFGNVYITGRSNGNITFGDSTLATVGGLMDVIVAKYSSNGDFIWAKMLGEANYDAGEEIIVDHDNNFIITGTFRFEDLALGDTTLSNNGGFDVFIAKYDPDGSLLWASRAGGLGDDNGQGITVDADNNIITTGRFAFDALFDNDSTLTSAGDRDIYLAKYNPEGTLLWVRQAGGDDFDEGLGVAVNAAGDIYMTGNFHHEAAFQDTTIGGSAGKTIFVAKYDSDGMVQWAHHAGGLSDSGYDIVCNNSGDVLVSGSFEGEIEFHNFSVESSGSEDVFLARVATEGIVGIDMTGELPNTFELYQNYPNPFNPETTISYSLSKPGSVTLEIYNILGQKIRAYHKTYANSGSFRILWDGNDQDGRAVSSGVYLYTLKAGNVIQSKLMNLIR